MNIYIKKDNNNSNHLVIDNLSDLLKISPEKLKKAQYSDFSGKYFERINNEVIKMEKKQKNQQIKQNDQIQTINKIKKKSPKKEEKKDKILINNININNKENEEYKINNISEIDYKEEELINNNELYKPIYKNLDSFSKINKIDDVRNLNSPLEEFIDFNNSYPIKKIIFTIFYNTIFGQEIAISGSNDKLGNWDKNNLLYLTWSKGNKWIGEIDMNEEDLLDFEFKFVLCQNKEIITWEPGENNNVYFAALFNEFKEFPKGKYNKYQYEYNRNDGELILNCKWSN